MNGRIKIISGSAHPILAKKIAKEAGVKLVPIELKKFKDTETYVRILEKVRGDDVFIIQPTSSPVNDSIMELLLIIDAAKRASAGRINAVIPYFGYSRQDRKASAREPISAKLVCNLLSSAGVDRVITVDLHADQIQGFFDVPLDHFPGYLLFYDYFQDKNTKDAVAVAPDAGSAKRTRRFANMLHIPLAIIDKRRPRHNEAKIMNVIGKVKDKKCIILDDIIDTAGTIVNAIEALKKQGATSVFVCATHGVLSDPAVERLEKSSVTKVVLADTIPLKDEKRFTKLERISIAPLMGHVITSINKNNSLGELFDRHRYL